MRQVAIALAMTITAFASIAQPPPEWQSHAQWCLTDRGDSGRAYRSSCASGHYGAVLRCQAHNPRAQQMIAHAGQAAVNAFMAARAPAECSQQSKPCVRMGGAPAYLTNTCGNCRKVRLVGCHVGDVFVPENRSVAVPRCVGTVAIAAETDC